MEPGPVIRTDEPLRPDFKEIEPLVHKSARMGGYIQRSGLRGGMRSTLTLATALIALAATASGCMCGRNQSATADWEQVGVYSQVPVDGSVPNWSITRMGPAGNESIHTTRHYERATVEHRFYSSGAIQSVFYATSERDEAELQALVERSFEELRLSKPNVELQNLRWLNEGC